MTSNIGSEYLLEGVTSADRQMTLEISEEARRFIAQQGFDPVYGARPLRRFIAREVDTGSGVPSWQAMFAMARSSAPASRTVSLS